MNEAEYEKVDLKDIPGGMPLSIVDGQLVLENRAFRRRKAKGPDYGFYRKKGYIPYLHAIKIRRKRHGKISYKYIPVTMGPRK